MKTQLSLATIAFSLILTGAQPASASDLSFAFSSMKSAQRNSARPARLPRTIAKTTAPAPIKKSTPPRLLLGAYLDDIDGGLQVTKTVAGSPASQTLQPGDVLLRVSVLGQPTRTLDTLVQFEHAKQQIGVNRQAALEVYRPETGIEYVWVSFRPAGQLAQFTRDAQQATVRTLFGTTNDLQVSR